MQYACSIFIVHRIRMKVKLRTLIALECCITTHDRTCFRRDRETTNSLCIKSIQVKNKEKFPKIKQRYEDYPQLSLTR